MIDKSEPVISAVPMLILDAPDAPATAAIVRSMNRPTAGTLAFLAPPGGRLHWVVRRMLEALGKAATLIHEKPSLELDMAFLRGWLVGYGIQRVVVGSGHVLDPGTIEDIASLGAFLAADLTIVAARDQLSRPQRIAFERWGFARVQWDSFSEGMEVGAETMAGPDDASARRHHIAAYPPSDWPSFRLDLSRSVSPDDFARLDSAYTAGGDLALSMDFTRVNEREIDELLGPMFAGRPLDEQVAVVRGFQAAAFLQGAHVKVALQQLCSTLGLRARADEFRTSALVALASHRSPMLVALAGVLALPDADAVGVVEMRRRDLDVAGSPRARVANRWHPLPAGAHMAARAYSYLLGEQGWSEDDPLWVSTRQEPHNLASLRHLLTKLSRLTGAPYVALYKRERSHRWRQRLGISVQPL